MWIATLFQSSIWINIQKIVPQFPCFGCSDQFEFSTFVDAAASMLDDTGVSCGNRVLQASVMYPPTKHHKLYASLVHPDVSCSLSNFNSNRKWIQVLSSCWIPAFLSLPFKSIYYFI